MATSGSGDAGVELSKTPDEELDPKKVSLVIGASSAGTVFEWYDFFIYGTLTTTGIIGPVFFPTGNETLQLLFAWATFAVGFGFRPLGAVLLPFVAIGVPWGRLAHRSAGHGTSSSLVALARGAIHHRLDLVPLGRIQSCRTWAGPLSRRRRLSSIQVDIAGSRRAPSLHDLDEATGRSLLRSLPRAAVRAAPAGDGPVDRRG